jgi:pimeloyl-ACP methyl ester carboxylesterase
MTTQVERPGVLEAAALAAEHLDLLLVESVREVHTSVSARVYAGLGLGLRGSAKALRVADRFGLGSNIEDSRRGRFVISAVNGLIGDKLVTAGSPLAIEIGVRRDGHDVPMTPDGLAAAYPAASDAVVVFLHGLCETENYWDRRSRPRTADGSSTASYGVRLAADEGWSPVFVRCNTGVSLGETGVALSSLLSTLVEAWPTEVRRIALVGHSMGALIARAACAVSLDVEEPWTELVTNVVTLGAPHTGSPVERSIARGMKVAARAPELALFTRIFEQRSIGVLDLHDGMPEDRAAVPNAKYHLVAATLSKSPKHPLASTVGDYLVQYRSAVGLLPGNVEMFPGADVLHVPGADHFDLLNHDDVYAAMRGWLANNPQAQTSRS